MADDSHDSQRLRLGRPRISAALVVALAALALALAACGDDSGDSGDSAQQPATTQANGDGGGGATGQDQDSGSSNVQADHGPELLGDRAQARAGATAVDDVYGDLREAVEAGVAATDTGVLNTLDAAEGTASLTKVCDLMSEQARQRTIEYADRSAGLADVDWTCEKATGLLLRRAGAQTKQLGRAMRVTVVGVNADGDRATATVRFGGPKGRLSTISLVKEEGKWKLGVMPGAEG